MFTYHHRVSYSECTVGNHIYYGRYLDIMETARGEFSRAIGFPLQKLQDEGLIFPVIECRVKYRAPARYDDQLRVEIFLSELSRVRFCFEHRIWRENVLLIEAQTWHVATNLQEKPMRLDPTLSEALRKHLVEPVSAGNAPAKV